MTIVAGIDGCRAGWLYVSKNLETDEYNTCILSSIDEVINLKPAVLTIDIPIGLTDSGPRQCDKEARRLLGRPRASSVFPAPIRPKLDATTREQAGVSQQTWAIVPKIREVDNFLRANTDCQSWIREVHPEVCFLAWNNNNAMIHRKKSALGRKEREQLVIPYFGKAYSEAQACLPRGQYANDDLLDAFAALWTAERIQIGSAIILPANLLINNPDRFGLRMEIVA